MSDENEVHECPECGIDNRIEGVLSRVVDAFCESDSYGVDGSDFRTCKICGTGGSPLAKFEHAPDCAIREADEFVYAYGKYENRITDSDGTQLVSNTITAAVEHLDRVFLAMTDVQRLELINHWECCRGCGSLNTSCQCENDE